jgi:hypothetical protein
MLFGGTRRARLRARIDPPERLTVTNAAVSTRTRSVVAVLAGVLVSCDGSIPTRPQPAFADVVFVYTSTLAVGDRDPTEAGFCAHHALGASRLDLWKDGATLQVTLSMRPSGEPPRVVVTAERVPVDTPLVAAVWDLQCCSHTGPCSPTEELIANGTRLTTIVKLTVDPDRKGLAFRLRANGSVVQ